MKKNKVAAFKTKLCRDFTKRGCCPRGDVCTFAHGEGELRRGDTELAEEKDVSDDSAALPFLVDKDSTPVPVPPDFEFFK